MFRLSGNFLKSDGSTVKIGTGGVKISSYHKQLQLLKTKEMSGISIYKI